jgi:tetrahydrodipicolinate N-succinyltransferase
MSDGRLSTEAVLEAVDDLALAHDAGNEVTPYVDTLKAKLRDRYKQLDATADPPYRTHNMPLDKVLEALEEEIWQSKVPKTLKLVRAATVGAVRDHIVYERRLDAPNN